MQSNPTLQLPFPAGYHSQRCRGSPACAASAPRELRRKSVRFVSGTEFSRQVEWLRLNEEQSTWQGTSVTSIRECFLRLRQALYAFTAGTAGCASGGLNVAARKRR